ncbi:MAG TPA: hypothetical protein VK453_01355 [Micromonosporaceae bacterium]|nr:hypothetical protein [Micromonosporaceae bacterium]
MLRVFSVAYGAFIGFTCRSSEGALQLFQDGASDLAVRQVAALRSAEP